jgi:hypothetical protein
MTPVDSIVDAMTHATSGRWPRNDDDDDDDDDLDWDGVVVATTAQSGVLLLWVDVRVVDIVPRRCRSPRFGPAIRRLFIKGRANSSGGRAGER